MKACKRNLVLLATVGLCTLSAAVAQGPDQGNYPSPAPAVPLIPATPFAAVDRHLLDALQAVDERGRRAALRAAQAGLDNLASQSAETTPGAPALSGEGAEWLAQNERSLDRFRNQTRRELRESLMQKLWASPYGVVPAGDITALESISDALRLLRELKRLGGGDAAALDGLQAEYWEGLRLRRQNIGLAYTVLEEKETEPVFDQRVLRGKKGEIQIYQLTGAEDRTLHWLWRPARPLPEDFLNAGALTVDLSRESAPWLLVLEGDGLGGRFAAHRHWLEAIEREVRLVLLVRGDYAAALGDMPPEWFGPDRRIPYLLPARSNQPRARLHLVQVAGKRVLGTWPLANLDGPGGTALKDLINRILAAANPL